jgi:hypothetical protein
MTIRVTPDGQYRVNFLGGRESTAFYTLDLDDALETGLAMAAERKAAAASKNMHRIDTDDAPS